MSDSDLRHRDPRLDPPPLREDDFRSQRLEELESSNAMWGWIAGAVVLALVLMFVFTRGQMSDTTASNIPAPAATTSGSASPANIPAARAPSAAPSTTGQGSGGQ